MLVLAVAVVTRPSVLGTTSFTGPSVLGTTSFAGVLYLVVFWAYLRAKEAMVTSRMTAAMFADAFIGALLDALTNALLIEKSSVCAVFLTADLTVFLADFR